MVSCSTSIGGPSHNPLTDAFSRRMPICVDESAASGCAERNLGFHSFPFKQKEYEPVRVSLWSGMRSASYDTLSSAGCVNGCIKVIGRIDDLPSHPCIVSSLAYLCEVARVR